MSVSTMYTLDLDGLIAVAEARAPEATMESSARMCIADAKRLRDAGHTDDAIKRALRSLAYSVGVDSRTYRTYLIALVHGGE